MTASKTAVQQAMEAIAQASLDQKAKTAWKSVDVPVEHAGRSITLPAEPGHMDIPEAIEALKRKMEADNQEVMVAEWIDAYPTDAMIAFVKAMQNLYGWASPVPTPGFFGPKPPRMIAVKTGHRPDDVVQVPFGRFKIPGVEAPVNSDVGQNAGQMQFVIHGNVKTKDRAIILELANETRRIVKAASIYRGKAVRVRVDDEGDMDWNRAPEFMDVSDITESSLVFDADVAASISTNILTPIKYTAACRQNRIPLKRGVLLEGPYGTGKTLTARMTAAVCEANGWTFVLLDNVKGLQSALEFANRYSPAVVFAEDIDRVAAVRDDLCNDLVNTMDGVLTKTAEIMVILTTNHAEKLDPVILRPGRLDAVISLRPPSAEAAARLVRYYAGSLLAADADLSGPGSELAGMIPASIREAVERAKLGMVSRSGTALDAADLVAAARTMKAHMALLERRTTANPPTDAEVLADVLPRILLNGRGAKIDAIPEVEHMVEALCNRFDAAV